MNESKTTAAVVEVTLFANGKEYKAEGEDWRWVMQTILQQLEAEGVLQGLGFCVREPR